MLVGAVTVDDTTPDVEWWQRWQARWLQWVAREPGRSRVLLAVMATCIVLAVVASLFVDGFGRGARVWWWCTLILAWWLVLTPTRTVRCSSVLRMFSLTIPWAVVIAVASTRLADAGGLDVGSAGPSIGIAAVFEEAMKLVPLTLLGVLAPGRIHRFGATDSV